MCATSEGRHTGGLPDLYNSLCTSITHAVFLSSYSQLQMFLCPFSETHPFALQLDSPVALKHVIRCDPFTDVRWLLTVGFWL